ncbi:unnamed protein product, partial [Prunus brigantina]
LKKALVHINKKGKGFRASSSDEGPIAAGGSQYDFLVSKNILHRNAAAHPILLHPDDKHNGHRDDTIRDRSEPSISRFHVGNLATTTRGGCGACLVATLYSR